MTITAPSGLPTGAVTTTAGAFTVDALALKKALAQAKPAINKRGALPVLNNVRVDVTDTVRLTTTDFELTIGVPLTGATPLQTGTFLMSFDQAVKVVAKATAKTNDLVTVTSTDDGATDGVTFVKGNLNLGTTSGLMADWPLTIAPGLVDDSKGSLAVDTAALADVLTAAGTEDHRPILTGVYLAGGDVVATDSYRLHLLRGVVDTGDEKLLIPAAAVKLAVKAGGTATMAWGNRDVTFTFADGLTITSRLIDGEFPNYKPLLPDNAPVRVTLNRAEALAAIAELGRFAQDNTPVRIRVEDGSAKLSTLTQDVNAATITLPATNTDVHSVFLVAFNPKYLGDMLASLDGDTVTLAAVDALKPAVFTEPFCSAEKVSPRVQKVTQLGQRIRLLMPVRI